MKNNIPFFKTAAACVAFTLVSSAYTSCANSTSTTGSDTTSTRTAPAASDTMSAPTSPMSSDTTRKDSM